MVQAVGRDFSDRRRQFGRGDIRGLKKCVVIGQFLHLPVSGIHQIAAAIAQIDTPQTRHAVEQAVAIAVPKIYPLAARNDARALCIQSGGIGERMQMMGAV